MVYILRDNLDDNIKLIGYYTVSNYYYLYNRYIRCNVYIKPVTNLESNVITYYLMD